MAASTLPAPAPVPTTPSDRRRGARRRKGATLDACGSLWSFGSVGSILSIGSAGSILSIGSAGLILSIGSAGSILSIGSMGSIAALGRALAAPGRPGLTSAELGTLLRSRRRPR